MVGGLSGKPWAIGQDWDGTALSDFFKGQIDDIAFYNYELSNTEVSDKYQDSNVLFNTADNLIAHYSFNNGDIKDDSGNGNDGTTHGNPTFVNSIRGKAIQLDGVDDWAELTNFSVPENFTISTWIKPETTNSGQSFIGKHSNTGSNLFLVGFWGAGYQVGLKSSAVNAGVRSTDYQHLVVTVKKISSTQSLIKFHKDGILVGENTVDAVAQDFSGKSWAIGQDWDGSALSDFFKGQIDDIAFYNYDFSDKEVNNQYVESNNLSNNSDSIIAHYSFNNDDITDDSGNGNNGTIHGNPTFVSSARGKAIQLDGVDDWAELTDFSVPETFSISTWINPEKTNDGQTFIGKHGDAGDNLFVTGFWGSGYRAVLRNSNYTTGVKSTGYQHLVITVKKVSSTQSLIKSYKDGVLLGQNTINGVIGDISGKPWTLGQEWDGTALSDFFKGQIDDLTFYNYDLSEAEVNSVYRYNNSSNKEVITYSYDKGGNICEKTVFRPIAGTSAATTKKYTYNYTDTNWKDKLTSFDGKAITYDAIGNPLTYNGYTFAWEQGRQLKSITGNSKTISYKYNDSGIRTEKKVNGIVTKYNLVGDKVTYEENGTDKIYYTYDSSDNLVSMNLNGVEYYYIRNAQNDIIGLFDKAGTQVVSYSYDTWGKLILIDGSLKDSVGIKNEYRYRGYRYDTESGLYYLQSRYYNPDWGRFINADAAVGQIGSIQGHNMFQYCFNNPVNMDDQSGHWPRLSTILTGVAVVAGAIAITAVIVATAGAAASAFAIAGGAALGGSGAAGIGMAAGIVAIGAGAGAAMAKVAENTSDKLSRRENTVYKLVDKSTNQTRYVGRTKNSTARRNAHNAEGSKTAGLEFTTIASNLTYFEARGLEQIAMLEYNTKNFLNSVNGISPNNPRKDIYMAAGRQISNYVGNQISNEILYWTGK